MAHTEYSTYDVSPIAGANVRKTDANNLRRTAKEDAANLGFKQELSIRNLTGRDYWIHLPGGEKKHLVSKRKPLMYRGTTPEPNIVRFTLTTYEDAEKYNVLIRDHHHGLDSLLDSAKSYDRALFELLSTLDGGGVAITNHNLLVRIDGVEFLKVEQILDIPEEELTTPRFISNVAMGIVPGTYRYEDIPAHPFDYESVLTPTNDNVGLCHVKVYDPFNKIRGDSVYIPCLGAVLAVTVDRKPYRGTEAVIFTHVNHCDPITGEVSTKTEQFTIDDVLQLQNGDANTCNKTRIRIYDTMRMAREDEVFTVDKIASVKTVERKFEEDASRTKQDLLEQETALKTRKIEAEGQSHAWKVVAGTVAATLVIVKLFKL